MVAKKLDFVFSLSIFAAVFAVYLIFISSGYHYDSLTLAQFAENGSLFIYGWRQHSLLILINTLFYCLWTFFSPSQSALFPLAVLGCFVGALGTAVFFLIIRILFSNRFLALFGALGLAFSFNYWRYSVLVETHILSTFFLIVAVYFLALLKENESRNNVILSGIFTSLSVFSSGANIVFVPALLIFLLNTVSSKSKKSPLAVSYLITVFFSWFLPYLLLGLGVLLGKVLLKHQVYGLWEVIKFFILWFKSELYAIPFRAVNLIVMAKDNAASIFYSCNNAIYALIFYIITVLFFVRERKYIKRSSANITSSFVTAALFFFGAMLFYEPGNLQRYTPFLIFVWLFICVLFNGLVSKKNNLYNRLIISSVILFLFLINLASSIIPNSKPENNLSLQVSLLIRNNTGGEDIIIERGGELWSNGTVWPTSMTKYIPYFAHRRLISFMEIYAESIKISEKAALLKLRKEIDQSLGSGKKVLVFKNALFINSGKTSYVYPEFYSKLSNFLQTEYHIAKYQEKDGVVIYRLVKKNS